MVGLARQRRQPPELLSACEEEQPRFLAFTQDRPTRKRRPKAIQGLGASQRTSIM